ncbi:TonB-dependent receptor [soil metagenome]
MEMRQVSLLALSVAAAWATHASAQQNSKAPSAQAEGSTIAEIIVTAERRDISVQKTAAAISALTSSQLERQGITQPQDISKAVPSLKIATGGGGYTQLAIRGIGTLSGNAYSEQAVATNLDGAYVPRPAEVNGVLFDLDRIEVLKGPQGTLYGRNATAGAINIIARKPGFTDSGEVTVEAGNYDLRRAQGMVNLALSETVAVRLSGQTARHDGYLSDGYDDVDESAARFQIRFAPSDAVDLNISVDHSSVDSKGGGVVKSPFIDSGAPYLGSSTPAGQAVFLSAGLKPIQNDGYLDLETTGIGATLNWKTGLGTLTVIPAYRKMDLDTRHYAPGFLLEDTETSKARSLEARLASPADAAISWIVGGFAFGEDQSADTYTDQSVTYARGVVPKLDTRSYAVFGQATWRATDQLRLTAGLRTSKDQKSQEGTRLSPLPAVPAVAYPSVCPSPATFDATAGTCTSPIAGDATFNKTTWKIAVEYDVTSSNLLYANLGTGFKAGGFYTSLAPNTFQPETLTATAVGSKNRFLGNTLQINGEAYYWSYKNKQVTHLGPVTPSGFDLITENAGEATLYGLDLDMIWKPTANDHISANLQYEHSRFDSFVYNQSTTTGAPTTSCMVSPTAAADVVSVNCSGHRLALAPMWSGGVTYGRSVELGSGRLQAELTERFESSYWVGDEQLPGQKQKAYNKTDLLVSYTPADERWTLTVYGQNLEDKAVMSSSFVQPVLGVPYVTLRPPRTWGARLSAKF